MTAPPPRRPWYRRKMVWAVAAVWLLAAYPIGAGPAIYARNWGPLPKAALDAIYRPHLDSMAARSPLGPWYDDYLMFWASLTDGRYGDD